MTMQKEGLVGRTFGFLTVLAEAGRNKQGNRLVTCVCSCGKSGMRWRVADLKRRPNASCGCQRSRLASEARRTHGLSRTPEWNTWNNMKQRCRNPKHPRFADYGGRGIFVCDRWLDSFSAFIADMGPKPTPKHTIERIDNSLGYQPGNCRWATKAEQNANTRANHFLAHDGETLHIGEWARRTGISEKNISARIRLGWTVEDALTRPASYSNKRVHRLLEHDGETMPMAELARRHGITPQALFGRLARGMSVADALTTKPNGKHRT